MEGAGAPGAGGSGYPENPAFAFALQQARERAAGFNRSKQQGGAPDPPDSQSGADGKKAKDRKAGGGTAAAPGPTSGGGPAPGPTSASAAAAAVVAANRHPGTRLAAAEAAAVSAERLAAERAAGMYHHLPMHGRLGMGLGASGLGASGLGGGLGSAGLGSSNLLRQLQLSDIHNRMAFEQHQQERAALMAIQASRQSAWGGHPGAAAAAAAVAEERWRANLMAGRSLHPGVTGLGHRAGLSSPHLPPLPPGSEALPPELRAAEYERAAAAMAGASSDPAEGSAAAAAPGGSAGSAFDLLAIAAETTLRSEGREKSPDSDDVEVKPASEPSSNGDAKKATKEPSRSGKRKRTRKGANEPKNPLGAFVFYQRKIMADVFEENPCITFGEAAAECGRRWRDLPVEEKEEFRQMATEDKVRYTRELATFKNKGEIDVVPAKPAAKAKTTVRRKKPDADGPIKMKPRGEPKRAKSALLFFKSEEIPRVMKEYPNVTQKEASTEAAARYKALTKVGKEKYENMASQDKERYQREVRERDGTQEALDPPQRTRHARGEVAQTKAKEVTRNPDDAKTEKDINGWSPSAVQVPAQVPYDAMRDPNPYYTEEQAWRYHNPPLPPAKAPLEGEEVKVQQFPYVSHTELRPLPPPPPPPTDLPNTPFCRWSYNEDTRVLHADFRRASGDVVVTLEDEKFLLEMFERDDLTVISEGLVSGLDKDKWTLDYVSRVAGDEYYHRFRRFDKQRTPEVAPKKKKTIKKSKVIASSEPEVTTKKYVPVAHSEIDKMLSMKVKDFVTYLRRRGTALATLDHSTLTEEEKGVLCTYSFLDHAGGEHTLDVTESALYMLDYDMVKLLPTLYEDFVASFKLRGCLPGGSHCMMNCVNTNGRPFMGPNMYITPPGAFTHFHQDGHGTVDSGHYCLSGFNEVVMTRRLTERSKRHALRFLTGAYKHPKGQSFEGLYDLPHADNLGEKPHWPDNEAIEKCNEMNYCISRFILREGQCVHINKGRLHAFRKVSNEQLPPNDCHAKLRAELLIPGTNEPLVGPGKPEILCISVAWDWMYRGVTAKGINREIVSILECAALNRKYGALSLAIPELSLIQMARTLAPKPDETDAPPGQYKESLVGFDHDAEPNFGITTNGFVPSASVICKGIFPSLQYVVKQHIYAINVAESLKSKSFERGKRVSVAERPNAWENPVTHPLDPYGNSDFFCKLCNKELSNVYLHCDGCELLLSKDFNICLECHQEKRYATSVQMHPLNNKRHSTINHIGNFTFDRASRCPCKNGPVCRHCNFCAGCSCRCHSWFTLYFRFFKKADELKLLHRVKRLVGREELDAAAEAEKRLSMAIKGRYNEEGDTGPFGLHNMDVMVESQFADADDTRDLEEEPEEDTGPDESDAESGKDEASSQPKRKSRRLLHDPVESITKGSEDDADEIMADADEDAATSHIDRTKKDTLQVGVSDMKVTIRYRSCEWTEEERNILKQALEEAKDWEAIVAKLPDRGMDQIRSIAGNTFPALVEAFQDRNREQCAVKAEKTDGESADSTEPSKTEAKAEAEKPNDDNSDDAKKDKVPQPSDAEADAEAEVKAEEAEAADKDSESASMEVKEEPKEDEVEEKKSEKESDPVDAVDTADAAAAVQEEVTSPDKLPPANVGRWNDDEKERLRVALIHQNDMDCVEQFVGTRRMAAIRSFAPRTFPELYNDLRERMGMGDGGKTDRRRSSLKSEQGESKVATARKPDPDEVIEGEESRGPSTRRRSSRRGTRRSMEEYDEDHDEEEEAEVKQEDDEAYEDDGHKKKKEQDKSESDDVDDGTTEDEDEEAFTGKNPSKLQRARKNSARQVASGRGRRSTQDLSGGRKRRTSGQASRQADSESSEEERVVAVARKKRGKSED